MFKSLASCATLSLLALTTSAAPQYSDMRPQIIGSKTLFINTKIKFTQPVEVLDSTGQVVHMIKPTSTSEEDFIEIVSTTDPHDVGLVKVEKPRDCSTISGRYFFVGEWFPEDPNDPVVPPTPVFLRSSKHSPVGKVKLDPASSTILAKVSDDLNPLTTIPAGHYYSIYFPPRQPTERYLAETDLIALVVRILEDQKHCA